jgi:hypothetical protein
MDTPFGTKTIKLHYTTAIAAANLVDQGKLPLLVIASFCSSLNAVFDEEKADLCSWVRRM